MAINMFKEIMQNDVNTKEFRKKHLTQLCFYSALYPFYHVIAPFNCLLCLSNIYANKPKTLLKALFLKTQILAKFT